MMLASLLNSQVSNANDFGNSWKTGDRQCIDPGPDDVCPAGQQAEVKAKSDCNAIIDAFGECKIYVLPCLF